MPETPPVSDAGTTLETTPPELRPLKLGAGAFLFLVLECDRPAGGGARFGLAGVEEAIISRDARRSAVETRAGGRRRLTVSVPDARISREHARLSREGDRFRLDDLGSRNGCLLNGATVTRALIEDGDLIQLGHTLFLFRQAMPLAPGDAPHFDGGEQIEPDGLATLLPPLQRSMAELSTVASSDVPIVLRGETGTGKEVLARRAHERSGRPGAFVALNCGGLPAGILQSELFGVKKGAFSGAGEDRTGLVRAADRGTLLLDEVGDLPLVEQAAFLRVLQEREVTPLGGTRPIRVDVRLLSATHRDLEAMVAAGSFRGDLFARISGFTLQLTPLRERREDLGLFIASHLRRTGKSVSFTPEAGTCLLRHGWRFNARELTKCLEASIALARQGRVGVAQLPAEVCAAQEDLPAREAPLGVGDQRLREELLQSLRDHGGNVSAVARSMNKARVQIHRWMKRYQIDLAGLRRK